MIIHFDNQTQKSSYVPAELFRFKLASAILQKDKWKSDDIAKNCFRCEKAFIYLIRRKHHCRRCGQVFCAECSENFLDGIFFSPDSEKAVRFCVKCYDELSRYLKKNGVDIQNTTNIMTLPLLLDDDRQEIKDDYPVQGDVAGSRSSLSPRKQSVSALLPDEILEIQDLPENYQELQNDHEFNPDYDDPHNIQALFADDDVITTTNSTYVDDKLTSPSKHPQFKLGDLNSYSQELKEKSYQKIDQLCEFMGKKYSIHQEWGQIMPVFIKKAVEDINIESITTSGEPMDINFYVKIKKIPFIDQSVTGYFKGVVFRKNVSHKRMKNSFVNPKIMIITGNLEVADSQGTNQSFDNLVNNERKNIKKVVDKITKYKPDLLLVEKSVNRLATELLLQANISVVQNIQQHILRKIAKCTRAKYIKLDRVDKYSPDKVLGQASNIIFRNYNPEIILQNKEVMDTLNDVHKELLFQYIRENKERDGTLMFLETPSGQNGVTMTLSGPQIQQLKYVKKSIMGILRLARHFHLEKELILYECRLKNGLKMISNKDHFIQINANTGDLTKFVYERMNLEELIRKDSISYTKINYVQADLGNFNDIKDNHQALEQYFKENHQMTNAKVDFFAEICQIPTYKRIEFYSKDDTSLAAFILLKVSNMEQRCSCRRLRHQHVSVYYGSGVYIKFDQFFLIQEYLLNQNSFQVEVMSIQPPWPKVLSILKVHQQQQIEPLLCRVIFYNIIAAPQVYNQIEFKHQMSEEQNVLTQKDLVQVLQKKHKSQNSQIKKVVIESYIECNTCGEKISDAVRLKKINMEYSFLRFLQHMFISGVNSKEINQENKEKCEHNQCSRVFAYEEAMVKFFVSNFKFYSVSQVSLTEEKLLDHLKKWEVSTIVQKKEQLIVKLDNIKEKLITMIQKIQNQLQNEAKQQHLLLKAELDQLCQSIIKIKMDALQKIQETKYKNVFEVENDNQQLGQCFKEIYDNILEAKRSKEIGNDLKLMLRNNVIVDLSKDQHTRTERDLDFEQKINVNVDQKDGTSDPMDSNSVQSDKEIRSNDLPDLLNLRRTSTRVLKRSNTQFRKIQSQEQLLDLDLVSDQVRSETLLDEISNVLPPLQQGIQTTDLPITKIQASSSGGLIQNQVRSSFLSQSQILQEQVKIPPALSVTDSKTIEFNFLKEWNISAFPWEQDKTERTIQKYEFVQLQENDHMSYIAFALNHSQYMHQVYLKEGFQNFEDQKFPDTQNIQQFDFIKNKIAQGSQDKEKEKELFFSLKLFHDKPTNNNKQKPEQSPNLLATQGFLNPLIIQNQNSNHTKTQDDLQLYQQPQELMPEHRQSQANLSHLGLVKPPLVQASSKLKYSEILVYFPVQFEALRIANNISLSQFIKSINSMTSWDSQGGKSDSSFFKSSDDLFVFKKLQLDKEFIMFRDFAMEYFKHMWRLSYENKPSLLCKIFGMFEVRSRNQVGYYLAMENLFVGMGPQAGLQVYDLKGSKTNRWEQKKKRVLLDTNFRIDRNAEPIPVLRDNFRFIDRAFQNDCKFLFKQKVIDYSLLLIIDKKQQKIRLGIIDYLRYYTWDKETEHLIKLVLKGGMVPTIVNPQEYKKRFLEEMSKYFIDVSNEN